MTAAAGGLTWARFAEEAPDLAEAGRALLYQFGGVGLGFVGTVRADGGPRLHPMCPMLTGDALLAFIEPGPKRQDLHRDARYALHCFPPAQNEDAFYVTGTATAVADPATVAQATAQWTGERGLDEAPPGLAPRSCSSCTSSGAYSPAPPATATGTLATRPGTWVQASSASQTDAGTSRALIVGEVIRSFGGDPSRVAALPGP